MKNYNVFLTGALAIMLTMVLAGCDNPSNPGGGGGSTTTPTTPPTGGGNGKLIITITDIPVLYKSPAGIRIEPLVDGQTQGGIIVYNVSSITNGTATVEASTSGPSILYPADSPIYIKIRFFDHYYPYNDHDPPDIVWTDGFLSKTAYHFDSGTITESFSDFLDEDAWEEYTGYND